MAWFRDVLQTNPNTRSTQSVTFHHIKYFNFLFNPRANTSARNENQEVRPRTLPTVPARSQLLLPKAMTAAGWNTALKHK